MNGIAISWKSDECFTCGKRYKCTVCYENCIKVLDDNGQIVRVGLDDPDFTFILR